jgi:hypothetical protein
MDFKDSRSNKLKFLVNHKDHFLEHKVYLEQLLNHLMEHLVPNKIFFQVINLQFCKMKICLAPQRKKWFRTLFSVWAITQVKKVIKKGD